MIQLTESGNILKIFHLKGKLISNERKDKKAVINFQEEFEENNIYCMANEFLNRIEKVGMLYAENDHSTIDPKEEDNAKNYFFPTRHKMLKYLHIILEYAKQLIEKDSKVVEVNVR